MAKFYDAKLSNTSGELSYWLAARSDLAAYNNGASEMSNCIVLPQGGFTGRPGVKKIAVEDMDILEGDLLDLPMGDCRLVPFVVSQEIAYVLAFRGPDVRFPNQVAHDVEVIKDGVRIFTIPKEVGHPYIDLEDMKNFRYLQSVDVLYIFSPKYPVWSIKRYADDDWRTEYPNMVMGPFQDWNADETKTMQFDWHTTSQSPLGTLTANFSAFAMGLDPSGVPYGPNSLIKLEFNYPAGSFDFQYTTTTNFTYVAGIMYGKIDIKSYDAFIGDIVLYRQTRHDDGTLIRSDIVSRYSSAGTTSGTFPVWGYSADEQEQGVTYYIEFISSAPSTNPQTFKVRGNWSGGLAFYRLRVDQPYSHSTAHVVRAGDDWGLFVSYSIPPTSNWTFGTWGTTYDIRGGEYRNMGYPSVGIFHQERLVLGNSPSQPTTIWMSQPADWYNFDTSDPTKDTDSITVTLATKQMNAITDFSSRGDLLIFTEGGEFSASTGQRSDVFTPSSVVITPTDYKGSSPLMDVLDIGSVTLFTNRFRKAVYSLGYQLQQDGYVSSELSILSHHLFEWSRIVRWGYQQLPWSIVWIVLEDGTMLAFTFHQEHQVAAWTRQTFKGKIKDLCVIPGVDQDDVYMIMDEDLVMMSHVNVDNEFWSEDMFLDEDTPYPLRFESVELEQPQAQGSVVGRHKIVPRIVIRVLRTCGFKMGAWNENSHVIDQVRFPGDLSPEYRALPYTGDIYLDSPGGYGKTSKIIIENDKPTPVTILGMWREVVMQDDA